jgi:hypothetical protein
MHHFGIMIERLEGKLAAMKRVGIDGRHHDAQQDMSMSRKGPWALSNAKPSKMAMPNQFFVEQGLLNLFKQYEA